LRTKFITFEYLILFI